jgi:hypothetical protein
MNKQDFLRNLHSKWKKQNVLLEQVSNSDIPEYECYFRLRINANKTQNTLEDILVYIRGINGVTIVRSGETTKRNEANIYSTRIHIKYTPETFNKGVSLENIYQFLEKEIRKFGPAVSLTRLTPPPGELVVVKGKQGR